MAQPSNLSGQTILSTEQDLRDLLDSLYETTQAALKEGTTPRFKGLLEYMKAEVTILTAIYNIKSNKGSETPGSDGETMREHILEKDYAAIIARVQAGLTHYIPLPIRRKYIPKPEKTEKRPLGIPAIIDRIIQECMRIILEPIMEPQFFKHSYGFRPMRDAPMALERTKHVVHLTGYHWIVEGDIAKFFDTVHHAKLGRFLYGMGVRDQRVLMIIKAMVKTGIMNETPVNPLGTQQGGILSPLLANVYLHQMDHWVTREWEDKKTRTTFAQSASRTTVLKQSSRLKPAYLVRYADDWVLIVPSKRHAEKWKQRIAKQLQSALHLTLSEEKTIITNVREKPIHFLGCEFKVVKGKSRTGYITRTRPDRTRLQAKMKELHRKVNQLKRCGSKEQLMREIYTFNAAIRGIIQYYQGTTWVNIALRKYAHNLRTKAMRILEKYGGIWLPAHQTKNLPSVHTEYTEKVPAIQVKDMYIGVTSLSFCRWKKTELKRPKETPYTAEGRAIYRARTSKKPRLARADDILTAHLEKWVQHEGAKEINNFEYALNRAYAYNRDKKKCRTCGEVIPSEEMSFHRINPYLPLGKINRVNNLASVHERCHRMIHDEQDYSTLEKKQWRKIQKFREKL